jgi:hypothetical protein
MLRATAIRGFELALLLAVVLAGCKDKPGSTGGSSPPAAEATDHAATPEATPPAGEPASAEAAAASDSATATTWAGTWVRTKPAPGKGTMELTIPAGGSASISATASACYPAAKPTPAVATIDDSTFEIAVDANGVKASYSGTVSGDEASGTMTVTCAAGTGTGTWKLKKR